FRSGSDRERGTETASLRLHQAFCRGPVLATVRDSEVPFEPSRARRLQRLEEGRTPSCICETSLRLSRLTANPHRLTTATENPAKGNRIRTPPLQMVCSRRCSTAAIPRCD